MGSANSQLHRCFPVDPEGTRKRARYHWKALTVRFLYHLLDSQTESAFATSVEMKLFWLIKWCPIRVNSVATDKGHIGIHYDRRDQNVNESSRIAILEVLRSIRRFLKFSSEPVAKVRQTSI
ncbi:uncharacterized protein LOC130494572 isoform X1 [Raphanus sativus]|uniref:Uncharacterized protein LOC108816264 isoform X1 n=1 Tax=Raphanus sativus TaxID=3726 RepID=A0A6J0KA74_RAPSA|nr:uncharacterized protein LOC108816264 isoform X1 [Raphanus sativus]XP_056846689.1 uncharacterized protein LOC108816264 isoform X1 [Raphanus sativus]XP_056847289.1 uncharacterized protein LOC130494572 isoform X1 [Raphanus sativus]XP_056847290.1 uncharacterized protein LOC130494572 isoform X1 [Raphanus sativus]